MVAGSLNDKSEAEGSCAKEIVDVGEGEGGSYWSYYRRGGGGVSRALF